jgi:hypothetical protein
MSVLCGACFHCWNANTWEQFCLYSQLRAFSVCLLKPELSWVQSFKALKSRDLPWFILTGVWMIPTCGFKLLPPHNTYLPGFWVLWVVYLMAVLLIQLWSAFLEWYCLYMSLSKNVIHTWDRYCVTLCVRVSRPPALILYFIGYYFASL